MINWYNALFKIYLYVYLLTRLSIYLSVYTYRAERHDFWPRLWLFFSPFPYPPKKEGRRKGEWLAKIVIKSHAFLLDRLYIYLSIYLSITMIVLLHEFTCHFIQINLSTVFRIGLNLNIYIYIFLFVSIYEIPFMN